MTMGSQVTGVVGSDGYAPIYDPDGKWTIWSIHDIYTGASGSNKYIPKVLDYVVEPETGALYVVTDLDNITYIPEMSEISLSTASSADAILSSTNDNYRVYYDKTTHPYTLMVDGLLRVYGSEASYARLYKGDFIDTDNILSKRYDNSGNFIGVDIPLEVVAYNTHDNYAIKSVPICNTESELVDGEVVTVVVYNSNGKVVVKTRCILEETTYIPQAFAEDKYVTNVYLKSVFLSDTNDDTINYPVNLPIRSFNPIGVVQYNDGSQVEYPIDGDKFRLYGLDQFTSTIVGHRVDLVLSYRLDPGESALSTSNSTENFITKPYSLVVSPPNTSYSVKLYVYPVWIDSSNGYSYRAYLMNLDRNTVYDVSNIVGLSASSPNFNPIAYGTIQRLTFTLNLANVSNVYRDHIHVQTVDIVLRGPANDSSITNIWEVQTESPSSDPYYGSGLRATIDLATSMKLNIGNNLSKDDFIEQVYTRTKPLYNPAIETGPLTPTHMEVKAGTEVVRVDIDDYAEDIQYTNPLPVYSNVTITFIKSTVSGDLKLSVTEMTIR